MRQQPRSSQPTAGWTTDVSSAFALAGFLALVFVGFTLLAMGPLVAVDGYFNIRTPPHGWLAVLHVLDRVGQRTVCLLLLLPLTWRLVKESRSWRPLVVVVVSILAQNFVVGILKLSLGRGEPATGNPDFFVGGLAYPSGHTSNIVMVYGLMPYLLFTYSRSYRRLAHVLTWLVVGLSLVMVAVSLTLTWHWFADLISGLLIGGMMLSLTTGVDQAVPDDIFAGGFVHGLRRLPHVIVSAARHPVA
ncbi:MAG: phosphatase PAP2 family protein [Actinomycetota bacterium]|nr:phosphatase PAP2 family protein [Actinomycetota bacterium]